MFFYQKRSRLVLKHQPTANRPNVSGHARGLHRFYHKIAFPHNTQGEANPFGGAAMQAGRTIVTDLNAHDCVCRVCGAQFFGHGVFCPDWATTEARERAAEIVIATAAMDARIAADPAARRTRPRTQWREVV